MDRKTLLAAAIGRQFTFPAELLEFDGNTYEIRTPTVASRSRIIAAGEVEVRGGSTKFDHARMLARACVECVFVPATGADGLPAKGGTERLFGDEHLAQLLESPPGGVADVLGAAALKLMNVRADDVGKA